MFFKIARPQIWARPPVWEPLPYSLNVTDFPAIATPGNLHYHNNT